MFINLPLEPLENRYTEQWDRWFVEEFPKRWPNEKIITIRGEELTDEINVGKVLDANGTIYWKASQLKHIAELFNSREINERENDHVTFFIHDLQFPGWESILYMAHLNGFRREQIQVFGFLHASSWTAGDFAEPMGWFLRPMEYGWINSATGVFVGSEYHKHKIIATLFANAAPAIKEMVEQKIFVTGNPIRKEEYLNTIDREKEKEPTRIIWPHRFHHEKDPFFAVDVIKWLDANPQNKVDKLEFVFLNVDHDSPDPQIQLAIRDLKNVKNVNIKFIDIASKKHYYEELAKSTVVWSTSPEESFGYGNVEGIALGCHPVLTKCCSHIEIVQNRDRYLYCPGDILECADKLVAALANPSPPYMYIETYEDSFKSMIEIMKEAR